MHETKRDEPPKRMAQMVLHGMSWNGMEYSETHNEEKQKIKNNNNNKISTQNY